MGVDADHKSDVPRGDPYADWPYAAAYLLDTLDPSLIESHGRHMLCRALNIGRAVAFVGAGVSMSYGRISWQGLVESQVDHIFQKYDRHVGSTDKVKQQIFDQQHEHIGRLIAVLRKLHTADGLEVKADRFPMMFQLCQQLDNAMEALPRDDEQDDWSALAAKTAHSASGLHQRAMEQTRDDVGQANDLVLNAHNSFNRAMGKDASPDDHGPFRSSAQVAAHLSCSTLEALRKAKPWHAKLADPLLAACAPAWPILDKHSETEPVRPTQRHLFGVLAALGDPEPPNLKPLLCNFDAPSPDGAPQGGTASERSWAREAPRQSLTPPDRDPLLLLLERLQISRFITTNYDLEIERLFRQKDYRFASDAPVPAASLLRPRAEDIVFDTDKAGKLIAFAARDREQTASVVYLHGRADRDGRGEIVVTETDYQERYLRPNANRDLVDSAISLAFGGNPILFIGSNMGEDDILRPFRQFMSARTRVSDRVAIALVPAMQERRKRIEEKIAHLGRYGVYTIHFGSAALEGDREDHRITAAHEAEWLPWIWSLRETMFKLFKTLEDKQGVSTFEKDPLVAAIALAHKSVESILDVGPLLPGDADDDAVQAKRRSFVTDDRHIAIPIFMEGISCEKDLNPAFDIGIINACIDLVRLLDQDGILFASLKSDPNEAPLLADVTTGSRKLRRIGEAYRIALEGAGNSVLALMTSARLLRARWDWDEWKTDWFRTPKARQPHFGKTQAGVRNPSVEVEYRHQILRPHLPTKDASAGRFYNGAPAQSFYTLVEALEARDSEGFRKHNGRRILLLSGRRGIGKGHFFNVLESVQPAKAGEKSKFAEFEIAMGEGNSYQAAGFYNLSFGHEVMSVFDGLAEFLRDQGCRLGPPHDQNFRATFESFRQRRIDRLSSMLAAWAAIGTRRQQRILVAINAIDMLFDKTGAAKNGQVMRLFDVLFDPAFAQAPIDFVFLCRDIGVPEQFKAGFNGRKPNILPRQSFSPRGESAWVTPYQKLGFLKSSETDKPGSKFTPPLEIDPGLAVHILHETRASTLAIAYFPRIALLLAHAIFGKLGLSTNKSTIKNIFDPSAQAFRETVRVYLMSIKPSGKMGEDHGLAPKDALPALIILSWRLIDLDGLGEEETLEDAFEALCGAVRTAARRSNSSTKTSALYMDLPPEWLARLKIDHVIAASLAAAVCEFDDRFKSIHVALGGGRMLLTLLLTGAFEITTELSDLDNRDSVSVKEKLEPITVAVDRYLERAILALTGVSDSHRSDVLIDFVSAGFRRRHEQKKRLPIPVNLRFRNNQFEEETEANPEMLHLMVEIVWHLSIIGQPVEADILAWCPRIQRACQAFAGRTPVLNKAQVEEAVSEALKLALNRSLVFQLMAEGAALAAPDKGRQRYAVHGLVQRNVFQRMGARASQFSDFDQFTLSLYATQPDDVPQLTLQAHREISAVIEALSGYPGGGDSATRFRDADVNEPARRLRLRLLRAAFGVMRSVYSVAVLARLSEPPNAAGGVPGREGYFEEHRRRVRWLIKAACDYDVENQGTAGADAAFYAEEIVWLYNECAVLSLVQGRLSDAQALLEAAFKAVKAIEVDPAGALHIRLSLNKAVVDIERGHGDEARIYLEVIASLKGEHPAPPLIAKGYLGLIAHLAGEVDRANSLYLEAIDGLKGIRRSRAASIFTRHRGDLLRRSALGAPRESGQQIENAIYLAQEGAHEDIRHLALLSRVKQHIDDNTTSEWTELHSTLDEVENYGRIVGMPRILCEVNLLRSRLLMKQGENRLAAALAAQGLETAAMNDLRLFKINALLILAEINLRRGNPETAKPLISLVERMAKSANQYYAVTLAQKFH